MAETLRTEDDAGVRSIVLTRAAEYNTITPQLRDELAAAIDAADSDRDVRVILLRAEGPAFCAGYGLDWSTAAQAREHNPAAAEPGRQPPSRQAAALDRAQRAENATVGAPWLPGRETEDERRPRSWD